jgi:nicotinate-nucleotide adenylyltransferase
LSIDASVTIAHWERWSPLQRLSPMPSLPPAPFGALVRKAPDAPPLRSELALPGMRIGLFGGSFNPVHDGHVHVAREAKRRLGLDRVWWLVSPQNPLKDAHETEDYDRRLAAVRAAADAPGFVVSDLERRMGVRYSVEVVAALRARHPRVRFAWIMGADNLASFHRWRDWTGIMAMVPVAVVARPGDALHARSSLAAQRFRDARVDPAHASVLVEMRPPAWLYLTARLNPASSSELRARTRASLPRR